MNNHKFLWDVRTLVYGFIYFVFEQLEIIYDLFNYPERIFLLSYFFLYLISTTYTYTTYTYTTYTYNNEVRQEISNINFK